MSRPLYRFCKLYTNVYRQELSERSCPLHFFVCVSKHSSKLHAGLVCSPEIVALTVGADGHLIARQRARTKLNGRELCVCVYLQNSCA